MAKKCFTIETRLAKGQFPMEYFEQDIAKQNRLFRIVWKLIQEKKYAQSQLNTYLQAVYHIDKRTANTLIQTAKGRLKALRELKVLERNNLATKISTIEKQVGKYKGELNELKGKVVENRATEKQLIKYRRLKRKVWKKKQRLNRMRQQLAKYDQQEQEGIYPVCWGGRQLFKAQYFQKENGFRSSEGWLHAYRRKRDGQVNFIGSAEEPMGNQNCQLTYDEERDCFSLRVRKDLEFMEDKKDKFFLISGLQFHLHREVLIKAIQEGCTPFTFRFLRRGKKWYLQVIFTWVMDETKGISDVSCGVIGLDFNDGFLSFSETDYFGNLIGLRHFPLKYHGMGNKADSEIQEVLAGIVQLAKAKRKPIAIENLNFSKKKAGTVKSYGKFAKDYNKMVHALDYSRYTKRLENACFRENIRLILVNPAYTSQIGMKKFVERMKLNRHQAAGFVIARRGQGFQDRLRKIG